MESVAKLLIIDDDPTLRAMLKEMLARPGWRIDTAGTRNIAVELLRLATYDLVLLDIFLPDTQGLELVDRIKEIDLDYRIILMSGYLGEDTINAEGETVISPDFLLTQAERKGVAATVRKPFDFDQLKKLIERILAER